jgi:hypothetical protein
MRTFAIAALPLGVTAAFSAPRIELDLASISRAQLRKIRMSAAGTHDLGYKQPNGEAVGSRQDWTERCPAGPETHAMNCPIPMARAFDHNDKSLPVVARIFQLHTQTQTCEGFESQNGATPSADLGARPVRACPNGVTSDWHSSVNTDAPGCTFKVMTRGTCSSWCASQGTTCLRAQDNEQGDWRVPSFCGLHADHERQTTANNGCDQNWGDQVCVCTAKNAVISGHAHTPTFNPMERVNKIDYTKRGTYLLKFDAKDAGGNHAEQMVFALILDDTTKPVITQCGGDETVEAATSFKLCSSDTATDNLDPSKAVTDTIKYTVQAESDGSFKCSGCTRANMVSSITGKETGTFLVTVFAHDFAAKYGHQWENNVAVASRRITVVDTTKPSIMIKGAHTATHECATKYQDMGAKAGDTLDDANGVAVKIKAVSTVEENTVGAYDVTYHAVDAHGNEANPETRFVNVRDTTDPKVTLKGAAVIQHRSSAGSELVDPGVGCTDTCDTFNAKTITTSWAWQKTSGTCGAAAITSKEDCDAAAASLHHKDETATEIGYYWSHKYWHKGCFAHYGNRLYFNTHPNAARECSTTHPCICKKPFDDRTKGEYVRTYTCTDHAGNSHSVTRKFAVIDKDAPVVTLVGESTMYVEASRTATYTDEGAKCHDYTDGLIKTQHSVHHHHGRKDSRVRNVDLKHVGKYTVKYWCKDSSGNKATPITRTVIVRDTTCPKITIKGKKFLYIEAGFKYTDAGAIATDSFDGPIKYTVDGDTVDTANAFYSRRSCNEIKAGYKAAKTGKYFITTWSGAKPTRTLVWCDMVDDGPNQGKGFTYKAVDGGVSTVPYGADAGSCAKYGMQMAPKSLLRNGLRRKSVRAHYCNAHEEECRFFPKNAASKSNYYLCSTNDMQVPLEKHFAHDIPHDLIAHAEAGKYIITYHAKDKAGNTECITPTRTVVVKDTLPPVISIKFGKALLGHSSSDAVGIGGVANKAGIAGKGNPFLTTAGFMAETTPATTNGWALAGVASAVTGLALLSFSSRKQAVATSVPV